MEITPKLHRIPGVNANPYLILDADGLTLIDTGLPGSAKKILNYLTGLGSSPSALKRILITHADFDHTGSLPELIKKTAARIFASPIEAEAMAQGRASRPLQPRNWFYKLIFSITGLIYRTPPIQVDELLRDGQILPLLGGLHVMDTSGHTPGHLSFFAPMTGVLFAGDSLVSEPQGLRGSMGMNTWDQVRADAAVREQSALGAQIVCPGHGQVVFSAGGKFPIV